MLADQYGALTATADDPDLHLHNLTPTSSGALDGAQNAARVFAPTVSSKSQASALKRVWVQSRAQYLSQVRRQEN
jgi:hypothetical protein